MIERMEGIMSIDVTSRNSINYPLSASLSPRLLSHRLKRAAVCVIEEPDLIPISSRSDSMIMRRTKPGKVKARRNVSVVPPRLPNEYVTERAADRGLILLSLSF